MMEKTQKKKKPVSKKILPIILGIVLIAGAIFGIHEYIYYQHHEDTDDAQIDGDIDPVVARVGGYVNEIRFQDNQKVFKGDTLVVLDDRDYALKLEQAKAALASAQQNVGVSRSNVTATQANIATVQANIAAAQAKAKQAAQDFQRYSNLYQEHAITKAQYDQTETAKTAADAQLQAAKSQVNVTNSRVGTSREQVSATQSNIAMQQANVDYAQLQLSYTVITAPCTGQVSKRNVQIGQLIQPGQTLFSVVDDTSIYVTANFKETQLTGLHDGLKADIDVDAYPDAKVQGTVQSFSGATGAKFSLLPPDNATGNFVKVVQRVPVRININAADSIMKKLRPGMSVNVSVELDNK